jgi:hypothetical protein
MGLCQYGIVRTTGAHRRGAEHAEVNTSCAKPKLLTTLVSGLSPMPASPRCRLARPPLRSHPPPCLISYGADFRDPAPSHLVAGSHARPPDVFPFG